jgi:SAM-dependent methyltransferase
MEGMMGPHVLWLAEWLSQVMDLRQGMRVLDLGCGKASSSMFLAREFGVTVHAADLWIKPGENWQRIQEAGMADKVIPIACEAHAMPFAEGYFDAIVSLDAYHYFGTDDLYLGYCTRFLRPGGQIGIAVPGVPEELNGVPGTWSPGGSGSSARSTAPGGGGATGRFPGACRSKPPTPCRTAGGTGLTGTKHATSGTSRTPVRKW